MRKRIHKKGMMAIFSIAMMATLFLGGCDNGKGSVAKTSEESVSSSEEVTTPEVSTEESSSVESSTPEPASQELKTPEPKEPFVADRSAVFELFSHINIGWNLGNTLDAHGAGNSLNAETYWGNPKTTQEMIDAIAAQGFKAVRIPVTFAEHLGKAPDYVINEKWLDRVQEIVDYALNAGLYVMIDTHHEPDFWLKPTADKEEAVTKELTAIWTQVAERFKDYDERLMFEGMNEPRNKGTAEEWNGGTKQEREIINRMNQAFVDAVRSTGGNNEKRILILCTYGNNAGYTAIQDFKVPEDNYIAVAVHMYTPYYFTYAGTDASFYDTWDGSQRASIVNTLKQLNNFFLKKDVPVIVTEFGAVNKGNSEEVIKWAADYLGAMNDCGIKCFWWDNGCFNTTGENFGIFNRKTLDWYDKNLADALIANSVSE